MSWAGPETVAGDPPALWCFQVYEYCWFGREYQCEDGEVVVCGGIARTVAGMTSNKLR